MEKKASRSIGLFNLFMFVGVWFILFCPDCSILSGANLADAVAWWNFEESPAGSLMAHTSSGANPSIIGTADLSGNGNHLAGWRSSSTPQFSQLGQAPDNQGLCLIFTGNQEAYTSQTTVTGVDVHIITPAQWTLETSVLFNDLNGWRTFVSRDGYQVGNDARLCPLYFQKTWDNYLRIQFLSVDGLNFLATTSWTVSAGQWYHVVGRSTGLALELYVDRLDGNGFQLEASTPLTGNSALAKSGDNAPWVLGRAMYNNNKVDYLNGMIDDVRLTLRALEPQEFLQNRTSLLAVRQTDDSTAVSEYQSTGDQLMISLLSASGDQPPQSDVTVILSEAGQLTLQPAQLIFTPQNWSTEQTVQLNAVDDDILESDPHETYIRFTVISEDPRYHDSHTQPISVQIAENDCGAWGYLYEDYNFDCRVDLDDYAQLAMEWLGLNETLRTFTVDWLATTEPYAPGAVTGPIKETDNVLTIHADQILNPIDEKIYGHFFEHIYHSANGGLWGDLVWNRSMEMLASGQGDWSIEADELVQNATSANVRLLFGDTTWTDYEMTCQAMKTGGAEGFLIICRANGNNFYWFNLGGWGNTLHAVEKGTAGGTWGVVGNQVNGVIESDRWHNIRMRCEGNRLRLYLDEELVLDYTDSAPYLTGQVGLGTWSTTARYRNIEVRDLANNLLFSGLPAINPTGLPQYWTSFGSGTAFLNSDGYNNQLCTQINNTDSSFSGIQQTPFNIEIQPYRGSFWAKGNGGTLMVRLLNGSQVLAQASLGSPGDTWQEYPFTLIPTVIAPDATLQVGLQGSGTVLVDEVSMMGQDSIDNDGYRPDLYEAVAALRPPIIRWPGGCYASAYRWKDGIGPQHQRGQYALTLWEDRDVNSYGTDEFLRMCERLNVEPIIVINVGVLDSTCGVGPIPHPEDADEYLQDALDWMEYCNGPADSTWGSVRAANGHPEPYHVKYWEIDNETWQAGSAAYVAKVRQFVPPMKACDPDITILVCGGSGFDQGWNQDILNGCADLMDYISVHHYEDPANYQTGPGNYENFIVALSDRIAASANPNIKIYMSEWNAQSIDWRTGLYAGGLLNVFERTGDSFVIGGPALFLRHVSAGGWNNAFINFNHQSWFPAPNYVVMRLWRDHYAPQRVAIEGSVSDLNVVATRSESGDRIIFKAVNPTDQEIPLRILLDTPRQAIHADYQLVAPGSLSAINLLENPVSVQPESGQVNLRNQTLRFSMPPLSAGVVEVLCPNP